MPSYMFKSCPQDPLWFLRKQPIYPVKNLPFCFRTVICKGSVQASLLLLCCHCNLLSKQQLQIHSFPSPLAAPGGLAPDPGFAFGDGREGRHGLPREPPRTGIPVFLLSHFGEAAVPGRLLRLGKRGTRWSQRREHPVAPLSGKSCGPEERMPLCGHLLVSTSCQTGRWLFLRTSPQVGQLDCPGFFLGWHQSSQEEYPDRDSSGGAQNLSAAVSNFGKSPSSK